MKKLTVLVAMILVVFVAMSTQGLCQEDGVDVVGRVHDAVAVKHPQIDHNHESE